MGDLCSCTVAHADWPDATKWCREAKADDLFPEEGSKCMPYDENKIKKQERKLKKRNDSSSRLEERLKKLQREKI